MPASANDDTSQRETNPDVKPSEVDDQGISQSEPTGIHDSTSPPTENDSSCTLSQHPGKELNGTDQSEVEMPKEAANKGLGNMEGGSENREPSKVDNGVKDNTEEEDGVSQYEVENENDIKQKFDEKEENVSVDSEIPLGGDIKEKNVTEEINGLLEGVEGENYVEEKLSVERSDHAESTP